ncbi:uncharacterized protein Dwil_GK11163 [Drosophila willistoni]|uniref:BTB domain-containing protein n=1 Tax=Drosophila willistoni TaxID=7260 RepID=B4NBL8_DROWI|nr:uncharacterized protein LOC6647738 [Drosophila willistoni]EDW81182.1 uncharacterized protein Dwil_GK11163 [Drosophila willistoni]
MVWSSEQVEDILNVLKTATDKTVIYKCLVKLRTDLVKDRDGILLFRTSGGVPIMVRLISKLNEKIMEVVLSILGNCCTDDQACIEAVECKVLGPLITILKTIPNPVIQCRACRMLGNLAKSKRASQFLTAYYASIAPAICHIIESTTAVQTRIMAFRVCRFLLVSSQFLKHFLMANGFLQMMRIFVAVMKNNEAPKETAPDQIEVSALIGLKRNQHREKYFEEVARNLEGVRSDIFDYQMLKNSKRNCEYVLPKEAEAIELAHEILKCLVLLSAQQIGMKAWQSISHQTSLAAIVYFVKEDSDQRSTALKILSNFSKDPCAFFMLSTADAIEAACEMLMAVNMVKTLAESESRHCINIIATMSTDACSRSKIRRCGALRRLVAMIRESGSQSDRSLLLHILNNFQYDNLSMELLLYEGLVPLLVRELNDYLTSDDEHHKRRREERLQGGKKRKLTDPFSPDTLSKFSKTQEPDFESPSSSPRSYRTVSPCSSRSMSPICSDLLTHDDNDENYSPACSDDDDDDDDDVVGNNAEVKQESGDTREHRIAANRAQNSNVMDILNLIDEGTEPIDDPLSDKEDLDELSTDATPPKMAQFRNQNGGDTIDIIENLIYRITLMVNKRAELGKPDTLDTLIRAINLFGANNNFSNALTNILLESQFFAQIIKHGVVHQLYQLTKVEEMRKDGFAFLETLTNVGESNYGKEELVRLLRCDDLNAQQRAAISVAFIIKSHRLLYQFLYDGNALTLLFDLLLRKKSGDLYAAEAADALTAMSRFTLGITLPDAIYEETSTGNCLEPLNENTPLHKDCDMRFVVQQDGEPGKSQTNSVSIGFNKQLLCDTSEVFNKMLNSDFREGHQGEIQLQEYTANGVRYFLHLIGRSPEQHQLAKPNYAAMLQAFEMSRVYIMPDMEEILLQRLIQFLDSHNCLRLLEWALKNYHTDLTETAINYYLCASLPTDEKLELFRAAEESTYASEWFQLLNDAVYERCRSTGY